MMAKARLSKKGSRQSKRHGKLQFSSQKETITGKNHTKIKKAAKQGKTNKLRSNKNFTEKKFIQF